MSIDINELRRLAQGQEWIGRWYDAGCETLMAERNGEHEEVAHPIPIGVVPYLIAVQPAAVLELLDRLEAAESDGLEQARLLGMNGEREAALLARLEAAEKERDALRSKNHQYQVRLRKILEEPENTISNSKALAEVIRQARIALGVKK